MKKLSTLQQKLFDMIVADLDNPDSEYLAALAEDISSMNAAELRHNIKVWRESE